MYKTFHVPKEANTYADTLEAYGVAHLLTAIFESQAMSNEIIIIDKGVYFEIISKKAITPEVIDNLKYFQVVKFIQKDEENKPPAHIGQDFYNYPLQRDLRREKRKEIEKAVKDYKGQEYTKQRKLIEEKYQSEKVAQPLVSEYDVFAQFISNPYAAFLKLHGNFDVNREHFKTLISEVLNLYLPKEDQLLTEYKALSKAKKINIEEKATMLQLINPNQGKGLNKAKATGISVGNLKGNWIKETMKVSGALNFGMICQAVKVGSSYDMKVFVPLFSETKLNDKMAIMKDFKRTAKSNTPIKLDIINTLKIIELFLRKSEKKERGKLKEHLLGLHSVYQKDLGQNKAVVNIGFLETPDFIDLADKEDWLKIIQEQKKLMNGITEQGDSMIGLLAYRNFLNGSSINEYFKFNYWYATYLMHELSNKKQTYITTNKIEILNKLFKLMDISFKEIIENEGFTSVASAIRKSTVSLQYTPKEQRKFDVQYGLAQKLKNKSNSTGELISFVGEFVAKYNSNTARQHEKTGQSLRANVKDKELLAFFELADKVKPKVLGAMLAAYGFALNKKEVVEQNPELEIETESEGN
jgi:hypothetical protein